MIATTVSENLPSITICNHGTLSTTDPGAKSTPASYFPYPTDPYNHDHAVCASLWNILTVKSGLVTHTKLTLVDNMYIQSLNFMRIWFYMVTSCQFLWHCISWNELVCCKDWTHADFGTMVAVVVYLSSANYHAFITVNIHCDFGPHGRLPGT